MGVLQDLFGGENKVGFFGGGHRKLDDNNYVLGEGGGMNARYGWGSQWAQDALAPNNPNNPLAQQLAARGQQAQLANSLFGTLSGNTPSVAQEQLRNTTQGNVANAYAMAAASGNPAAARMAASNAGNINAQAAGQAALLRAQEQQNAAGMLNNLLGGMRGQDQGMYQNLNQTALGYLGGQHALNATQLNANMAKEQQEAANFQGAQNSAVGGKIFDAGANIGMKFATAGIGGKAFGGEIAGYAKGGDHPSNDTVPAMLSPGEIVLPRSITKADDAPEKAKAFVEAIRAKRIKKAA